MKGKKNIKDSVVRFRCSESDYKRIKQLSKPYGSMSNFIRKIIFSDKKVFIDPKTFIQGIDALTTSVNRAGNNVNQIAKFYNITKDVNNYALTREWLDLFAQYNETLREVNRKIEELFLYK
jgi:hypothetical protein